MSMLVQVGYVRVVNVKVKIRQNWIVFEDNFYIGWKFRDL